MREICHSDHGLAPRRRGLLLGQILGGEGMMRSRGCGGEFPFHLFSGSMTSFLSPPPSIFIHCLRLLFSTSILSSPYLNLYPTSMLGCNALPLVGSLNIGCHGLSAGCLKDLDCDHRQDAEQHHFFTFHESALVVTSLCVCFTSSSAILTSLEPKI